MVSLPTVLSAPAIILSAPPKYHWGRVLSDCLTDLRILSAGPSQYIHVNMYVYIYVNKHIYIYIHIHVYMYVLKCKYIHIEKIYIDIFNCKYIYILYPYVFFGKYM